MAKVENITEGPILPAIVKLAWPVVAVMLLEFTLSITDYFWVGFLGTPEQDALTSSMVVTWTIFAVSAIIVIGLTAIVARSIGAGEPSKASFFSRQGILMSIGLGIILGLAGVWVAPHLMVFMKATPSVVDFGTIYLRVFFSGIIFFFINEALGAVFRAAGDTKSPMLAFAVGTGLNIFLDPVLIFGWGPFPEMGIGGAALATIISVFVTFLIFLYLLFRGKLEFSLGGWYRTRPELKAMLKMVKIGLPISAQSIVFIIVYWFIIQIVHHYGDAAGAAMGVGNRMESLSYLTAFGLSTAASTLVGQNLGAGKPERAARCAWQTILIAMSATFLSSILFIAIPGPIATLFSRDPEVIGIAVDYLVILGLSQVFMGIEIVLEGAFSGAGDTIPPMTVSIPGSLARLPLAYFLCFTLDIGINGVWWTLTITSLVKAIILALWFRRGRWQKKEL
jgi:putative MATE family efflux protein